MDPTVTRGPGEYSPQQHQPWFQFKQSYTICLAQGVIRTSSTPTQLFKHEHEHEDTTRTNTPTHADRQTGQPVWASCPRGASSADARSQTFGVSVCYSRDQVNYLVPSHARQGGRGVLRHSRTTALDRRPTQLCRAFVKSRRHRMSRAYRCLQERPMRVHIAHPS